MIDYARLRRARHCIYCNKVLRAGNKSGICSSSKCRNKTPRIKEYRRIYLKEYYWNRKREYYKNYYIKNRERLKELGRLRYNRTKYENLIAKKSVTN